ncbi:MAG: PH domain-containing protein [Microlunatus sp.]|nr:PH domain-containing protein [Microlunatus sp.]
MSEPSSSLPAAAPFPPQPSDPGPPSDRGQPSERGVKQTERPHPLTPLIRGWVVLLAILIGFGRQLIPDGSGSEGFDGWDFRWVLLGVGAILMVAALAGFLTWYFTRYVIDDEELRIETGAIFKNSKRVPFERVQSVDIIQQLAARIFGLAELRIEVGTGDSTIKLRYLTRGQAASLRDYLLSRAHGDRVSRREPGSTVLPSALTDLGVEDQPLVTVGPQRLVGSFLLSSEFLVSIAMLIVVLVVTTAFGVVAFALAALIPLAIGLVSMIGRRVFQMFNFTLAQSARGVRVTRGLFNLTSQSIPVNRIQGVRIIQPILWRRFGWYRVDVNVLGYGSAEGSDNDTNATSVLVPAADARDLDITLSRILPGFDLSAVELHSSPRRSRWLRPFDFWTLRYGADERVVITEHGWLTHVRNLVPHAKTQSVRLSQGPIQRRLRVADVHLDITRGPVTPIAHQLDETAARELTMTQLDRARLARAADSERRPVDRTDADAHSQRTVLARFGLSESDRLGSGGESEVYALGPDRVLRVYRGTHEAAPAMIRQLTSLYSRWQGSPIGLEVPQILDGGEIAGRSFSVDRRMSGHSLSGWLRLAETGPRQLALLSYLDAAWAMQRLPSPVPGPARLLGVDAPRQFPSLAALLSDQLLRVIPQSQQRLEHDIPNVSRVWDELQEWLRDRHGEPRLVHGDFCPPNCYVSVLPDGRPVVSGVGDFSPHTLHADPMMDVAGAVIFLELEPYAAAADDARWLTGQAYARFGPELEQVISMYRLYYGFYFSNTFEFDPDTYGWCQRQLTR